MEFKYFEINRLIELLNKIIANCKLPIAKMAAIHRLVDVVNKEVKLYRELHDGIIMEFADRDESGEIIYEEKEINGKMEKIGVKLHNNEECYAKLKDLDDVTFKADYDPIPVDMFGDLDISFQEFDLFNKKLFV